MTDNHPTYQPRGVAPARAPDPSSHQGPPSRLGKGGASPTTHCLHCGGPTKVRATRRLHNTYREITYQCLNVECSCSFVAGLEVLRLISPSGTPDLRLKLSPKHRNVPDELIAEIDHEAEAARHQTRPPDPEPVSLALPF